MKNLEKKLSLLRIVLMLIVISLVFTGLFVGHLFMTQLTIEKNSSIESKNKPIIQHPVCTLNFYGGSDDFSIFCVPTRILGVDQVKSECFFCKQSEEDFNKSDCFKFDPQQCLGKNEY